MAFDWNKFKQAVKDGNLKEAFGSQASAPAPQEPAAPVPAVAAPAPVKKKKQPAIVAAVSQDLKAIKSVAEEGKMQLFLKQVVVLLLVFLVVRYANGKLEEHKSKLRDQMSAIKIQQLNREDYLANKYQLLRLEPKFPDLSKKGDWLLRSLIDIFDSHNIAHNMDGNSREDASDPIYTVVSQTVLFQSQFNDLGKFLEDIENGDRLVRISDLSISKIEDSDLLGENKITVKFNALFPKEKYGPKLFKDYAQQMAQIQKEQKEAAAQTAQAGENK